MHISHVIAASVLLGTTNAAKVLPMHKRFSYDPLVNDFSYLGMLSKRDACSDAFGSSAHNSNCAPNFTLCCTRDGQSYPSCEKWLGKGWCCVGEGDNDKCYVDQASACNEQGAVQCKRLGSGTSKACCPRLTTCDDNTDATEQVVRCNIDRGVLIAAQSSSAAKTATTSTAASSSTEPPTSTTTSAPQTTAPESQTASPSNTDDDGDDDSTLSGGAIGGIVVGAVGGIGLIAGLAWFFIRRKKNKDAATPPQPTIAQYYDDQTKYQQQGYWPQGSPNPPYAYSSQPPSELGNNQVPVEMDGGYYQYQQQQQSPYQHQQSPIQHQQSPIQHQQSPIQHQSSPPPQQPSPFQQQHQQ